MENPSFWWYLPGKMGIFTGYVSFREGKSKNCWLDFCWRTSSHWCYHDPAIFSLIFQEPQGFLSPTAFLTYQLHLSVEKNTPKRPILVCRIWTLDEFSRKICAGQEIPCWNWNLLVMACWRLIVPSSKFHPTLDLMGWASNTCGVGLLPMQAPPTRLQGTVTTKIWMTPSGNSATSRNKGKCFGPTS